MKSIVVGMFIFVFGVNAFAQTAVYLFLRKQNRDGSWVVLERGGRFAHVAGQVKLSEAELRDYFINFKSASNDQDMAALLQAGINPKYKYRLWIHADPRRGVILSSRKELLKTWVFGEEVRSTDVPEFTYSNLKMYLGKPYDHEFSWEGDGQYCSKLLAQMSNYGPDKMKFDSPPWLAKYQIKNGQDGISPDGLYKKVTGHLP